MSRISIPAFTPTAVPEDQLLARTVGRTDVIDRILARLHAAAKTENRPHILVVGSRGSGKTHLLCVVSHLARGTPEIAERLQFVTLPEESHEIVSYADLLYAIVEHLAAQRAGDGGALVRKGRADRGDESRLQRLIVEALANRVLVLVAENLDRLLSDFGQAGQSRFRSFVETSGAVLLLTSTPLLSRELSDHAKPWYGAFHPEHLDELDLDDGAELLKRLAAASDDDELVAFLDTDEGRGRLAAMRQLTGGSPRMWIVLAGCMTIDNLDALVPVVHALLDELVPYYQERLGSLAGNERKLVVELSRTTEIGSDGQVRSVASGLRNVSELGESAGLDRQVVATTLGRLERNGWVRRAKVPGTDGRTSWYELREPMLRHHLQYRDTRGTLLDVIVGFLRAWYAPWEQRLRLAAAEAGSIAERYLSSTLAGPGLAQPSDALWAHGELNDLLVSARAWIDDPDGRSAAPSTQSPLAAIVAEVAVLAARRGRETAADAARARVEASPQESHSLVAVVTAGVLDAVVETDATVEEKFIAGLAAGASAATAAPIRDRVAVGLLAAGWRARTGDRQTAIDEMEALIRLVPDDEPALRLTVESALGASLWSAGRDEGHAMLAHARDAQAELLGPNHPDTLVSRERLAQALDKRDSADEAASLLDDLVPAYVEVFGARAPRTYLLRAAQAAAHSRAGEHDVALDLFTRVVADAQAALAATDELLLLARLWVAAETAETAGAEAAVRIEQDVVPAIVEALGPVATIAIHARRMHAHHLFASGLRAEAIEEYAALAAELEARLGVHNELTARARLDEADAHAHSGHAKRALAILDRVPPAREITANLAARAEISTVRMHVLAFLERHSDVIAIADQVLGDADSGFSESEPRTAAIAKARSFAALSLGDHATAVRFAHDLDRREAAAGVAEDTRAAAKLLRALIVVAPLDAWGFGTADETLRAARRTVMEASSETAAVCWLHQTLMLPPSQARTAIAHILAEFSSSPDRSAAGLIAAAASNVVPTSHTLAWLRAWPDSARSILDEGVVELLIEARDGRRDGLAKLPSEVRELIDDALAKAPALDELFNRS
jgi:tetratricopeptide (TPR) repeat protein